MHCTALAYHTKDIEPFFQKRVIRWNVKAKVDIFMHKISLKLKLKLSEADKYVTKFKWNISVHIKALNEYENKIFFVLINKLLRGFFLKCYYESSQNQSFFL